MQSNRDAASTLCCSNITVLLVFKKKGKNRDAANQLVRLCQGDGQTFF